jgi:hypothetical protein
MKYGFYDMKFRYFVMNSRLDTAPACARPAACSRSAYTNDMRSWLTRHGHFSARK